MPPRFTPYNPRAMSPAMPGPEDQFSRVAEILSNRPDTAALRSYASSAPNPEDYKLGTFGKIMAALAAGGTGAIEGPSRGAQVGSSLTSAPYLRALQAYRAQGEPLRELAGIESADTRTLAGAYGDSYDRALRQKESELRQQGLVQEADRIAIERTRAEETSRHNLAMEPLEARRVGATEASARAAGVSAQANLERARNPFGRGAGMRIGPESRVPVDQVDRARQMAIERLYTTDPKVRDYYEMDDKGNYVPRQQKSRDYWFDRDFNEQELTDMKDLNSRIDAEAEKLINTMVDPYAGRFPGGVVPGFGSQGRGVPYYLQR